MVARTKYITFHVSHRTEPFLTWQPFAGLVSAEPAQPLLCPVLVLYCTNYTIFALVLLARSHLVFHVNHVVSPIEALFLWHFLRLGN